MKAHSKFIPEQSINLCIKFENTMWKLFQLMTNINEYASNKIEFKNYNNNNTNNTNNFSSPATIAAACIHGHRY